MSARPRPLSPCRTRLERQKSNELPRRRCSAMRTFSRTVKCGNTAEIWNERTSPRRATSAGLSAVMSRPSKTMRPRVGLRNLVSRLKTVVLPAPFGPIRAWMLPRATLRLTARTATKPANSLVRSCASRTVPSPTPRSPTGLLSACWRRPVKGLAARRSSAIDGGTMARDPSNTCRQRENGPESNGPPGGDEPGGPKNRRQRRGRSAPMGAHNACHRPLDAAATQKVQCAGRLFRGHFRGQKRRRVTVFSYLLAVQGRQSRTIRWLRRIRRPAPAACA